MHGQDHRVHAHVRAGVPPRRSTTASGTVRRANSWPTEKDIKELEKNNFYMMPGAPVSDNSHHITAVFSLYLAQTDYPQYVD